MSFFGAGTAAATAGQTNTTGDISKDVQLNQPPEDSISDMRFSPTSDHLAVASWDKKVRIYEINDQGQSEGKALFEHEAPVLNCCWSPVSLFSLACISLTKLTSFFLRTEPRSSVPVPTKLLAC
jgi:mRNA export factor